MRYSFHLCQLTRPLTVDVSRNALCYSQSARQNAANLRLQREAAQRLAGAAMIVQVLQWLWVINWLFAVKNYVFKKEN